MMLSKVSLLGVGITISPKEVILAYVKTFLSSRNQELGTKNNVTIVTPNPEQIVLAEKNMEFRDILNRADIALPDGVGLLLGSRIFNLKFSIFPPASAFGDSQWRAGDKNSNKKYQMIKQRISGVDFMEELCAFASKNRWPVAFIGGKNGVAEEALTALQKKFPGLTGFGEEGPFIQITNNKLQITNKLQMNDISDYSEALAKRIEEENIRFVFVGMGAPKQEYFIEVLSSWFLVPSSINQSKQTSKNQELRSRNSLVFMAVGGSFDFLAGKIRRAPKSVQKLGFEWLWRLFQEPWRIKRQMVLFSFFLQCLLMKDPKNG